LGQVTLYQANKYDEVVLDRKFTPRKGVRMGTMKIIIIPLIGGLISTFCAKVLPDEMRPGVGHPVPNVIGEITI
jgi:hypothetical protein